MTEKSPTPSLLVDVGNTTVKLRLADRDKLRGATRRLPTASLLAPAGAAALRKALAGWHHHGVLFSSVVPAASGVVLTVLPAAVPLTPRLDTGVDLRSYPGVRTLGADRLANLAGALAGYGPPPLIVVDFGTAATFNVLDARGRFLGGTIAPGWEVVSGCLPARTAQLPSVRFTGAVPRAIGRDTVGALRAGTILGFRGSVREILDGLSEELGAPARVIATGGDARLLAAWMPSFFDSVDPDLTLHGLRVIAARLKRPTD